MILDVGCGHQPKGNINVDLYLKNTQHRSFDQRKNNDYNLNLHTKNLINADCLFLPFKDKSFKIVYSSHLIEHIENTHNFIKELLRICNFKLIIKCPHRIIDNQKIKINHKHSFNIKWFKKYFEKRNILTNIFISEYKYFPHIFFPIFRLPAEITVIAYP